MSQQSKNVTLGVTPVGRDRRVISPTKAANPPEYAKQPRRICRSVVTIVILDRKGQSVYIKKLKYHLPHVDQILGQCDRVRIAGDGNRSVCVAAVALLAVGNAYHGAGNLANLCNLGATLTDNAAYQVVWHGHFVGLRLNWSYVAVVVGSQLRTGQCGKSCVGYIFKGISFSTIQRQEGDSRRCGRSRGTIVGNMMLQEMRDREENTTRILTSWVKSTRVGGNRTSQSERCQPCKRIFSDSRNLELK